MTSKDCIQHRKAEDYIGCNTVKKTAVEDNSPNNMWRRKQ